LYSPNSNDRHPEFVKETTDVLRSVINDFKILFSGFCAHVGNDTGVWKGVTCRHGDVDANANGKHLLQPCCNIQLSITKSSYIKEVCENISGAEVHWVNGHTLIFASFQVSFFDQN